MTRAVAIAITMKPKDASEKAQPVCRSITRTIRATRAVAAQQPANLIQSRQRRSRCATRCKRVLNNWSAVMQRSHYSTGERAPKVRLQTCPDRAHAGRWQMANGKWQRKKLND